MYIVFDTTGHQVGRSFTTWKGAYSFIIMSGRYDWTIKEY